MSSNPNSSKILKEKKRLYYEDKKEIKNNMLNRVMNRYLDPSNALSDKAILTMQTLMPEEVKKYAERQARDVATKLGLERERDSNKNLRMFNNEDNPINDMLYILTFGNTVRKTSIKKIEEYTSDEFVDLSKQYLEYCSERKIQPNIPGLATWLGCSTDKLIKMNEGSKECSCKDGVQLVMSVFQSLDESLASSFKTNGAVHIFNSKNYYGMQDRKENKISIQEEDLTKRQKIIDALPTEYFEIK